MLAPTIFMINTAVDHVLGKTAARGLCGATYGIVFMLQTADLDYADDMAILDEIIEVIHLALTIIDEGTKPLGLQISWQKTKLQPCNDFLPPPAKLVIDNNTWAAPTEDEILTPTPLVYIWHSQHLSKETSWFCPSYSMMWRCGH